MSWYVVRNTGRAPGAAPYVVCRVEPYAEVEGIIKVFEPGQVRDHTFGLARDEPDHRVRARAQTCADRLNAGGIAREQTLRDAQAGEAAGGGAWNERGSAA